MNNLQEQIAIMIYKIAADKLNKSIDLSIIYRIVPRAGIDSNLIIHRGIFSLNTTFHKTSTVYSLINENNHNRQEMMYLEVVVIAYRCSLIKRSLPILLDNAEDEQIAIVSLFPDAQSYTAG